MNQTKIPFGSTRRAGEFLAGIVFADDKLREIIIFSYLQQSYTKQVYQLPLHKLGTKIDRGYIWG